MGYPQTDVFLVCFSLVDKESFKNALNKLIPEVSKNSPNTPIVLVGTKSDLKKSYEGTEKDSEIVPTSDGLNLSIRAAPYRKDATAADAAADAGGDPSRVSAFFD